MERRVQKKWRATMPGRKGSTGLKTVLAVVMCFVLPLAAAGFMALRDEGAGRTRVRPAATAAATEEAAGPDAEGRDAADEQVAGDRPDDRAEHSPAPPRLDARSGSPGRVDELVARLCPAEHRARANRAVREGLERLKKLRDVAEDCRSRNSKVLQESKGSSGPEEGVNSSTGEGE